MTGNKTHKFTTYKSGPVNEPPIADLAVTQVDALLGSIIQLDGRGSRDPEGQPLSFIWSFVQVPIGSEVEAGGFRNIRPNGAAVSFIPDKTGFYVVQLVVNDGELDSAPITASVNIQLTRVPTGEAIVPDPQFLWSYISNFWQLVEDREVITAIWSSVVQMVGAEMVKLWGNDYNKSLSTVQGSFQRRWQKYSPRTDLSEVTDQRIIVGANLDGTGGRSGKIGEVPGVGTTSIFYVPLTGAGSVDFTVLNKNYGASGRIIVINGVGYTVDRAFNENLNIVSGVDLVGVAASTVVTSAGATFVTDGVQPEDYVIIKSGSDAGTYRVDSVDSENQLTVTFVGSTTPTSFTGFSGISFSVVRPYSIITTKESSIPDGLAGVDWRIPNLLHTPAVDLEAAGIRAGDILVFKVTRGDARLSAELRAQVVAVDGKRLGFQFTLEDLEPGSSVIDHRLFRQLALDLRIASQQTTSLGASASGEALISYIPPGINLSTRPFSVFRITFQAKRLLHNSVIPVSEEVISIPSLQEQVKEPPVILRENLDYSVESSAIVFTPGIFTLSDPAPETFWAETVFFDNSGAIENNFGRLVSLSKDDLTEKRTRAPYLSAVKGLFFAYTNGPTVANIRLGLQILLGLPFTEERGILLEVQPEFTTGTSGQSLGRVLIEDVDEKDVRSGFRRVYFYPTSVGLEINPVTGVAYVAGDIIEAFSPLSAGIDVEDYVKTPRWWERAIYGAEVLKYFLFKVAIDSDVFDSDDVIFAYDFLRKIKPAYTRVVTAAILRLSDDIETSDLLGGAYVAKMYDSPWGLEATLRLNDYNHQGVVLLPAGSKPLMTRTLVMLRDLKTFKYYDSGLGKDVVRVYTPTGWDPTLLRARDAAAAPMMEGDILVIHRGQPGAGFLVSGFYEIAEVIGSFELRLLIAAPTEDPTTFGVGPTPPDEPELDPDFFEYGEPLTGSIVRRLTFGAVRKGQDLATTAATSQGAVTSAGLLNDGVSPGHHLIIEGGANEGEYLIDGVNAAPPYVTDSVVVLKDLNGDLALVTDEVDQDYWVLDPRQRPAFVEGAKSVYTGSRVELEITDPSTGIEFHLFTPGMLGTTLWVSDSDETSNDGEHLITEYISPGKVALDSASTTSDTTAQATIHF